MLRIKHEFYKIKKYDKASLTPMSLAVSAHFVRLCVENREAYKHAWSVVPFVVITAAGYVKGAVSYRFSQGLLTLMCNNSELKVDINVFFFLLRRQTS